jgi:hypothetical protein
MIIDFTDKELDIIFECLDERRMCSDDEEEILLIHSVFDKLNQECNNGNS